jgi:aspartyl-tRNA(Asn)/glutamyl-tRNA(Gln) amidotransferase subunit A
MKWPTMPHLSPTKLKKYEKATVSAPETVLRMLEICKDSDLNAFITLLEREATDAAYKSAKRAKEGRKIGPLDGVAVAIKDNIYIKGVRSTAGSKILADFVPSYDSEVVRRLKGAGAIIIGTTNMHEFASGVTSVNPHWGAVRNPYDRRRIAGGSSGGSAAAVGAGLVTLAVGTDTSGSVRIPASLCGVFGFKPTWRSISLKGVFPLSPSLDTVGVFSRDVKGVQLLFDTLRKSSRRKNEDKVSLQRISFVVPRRYFFDILSEEVEQALESFIHELGRFGYRVEESKVDIFSEARAAWAPIRLAEAAEIHLKWMSEREADYGSDVLDMLRRGMEVRAVEYIRARNLRKSMIRECSEFLRKYNEIAMMITPTCPITAPLIGDEKVTLMNRELDVYSMLSRNTFPFNVTGSPSLSYPAYLSKEGLPIGVQITANLGEDNTLLATAQRLELSIGTNKRVGI